MRQAGRRDGGITDELGLDGLVRIEDCRQQTRRRFIGQRRQIGADRMSDRAQLVARGATLFEYFGSACRVAGEPERLAVLSYNLLSIRI